MVYALVDCLQDSEVERTQIPKGLWMVLIIALPYVGPIAWIIVAKVARPPGSGQTPPDGRGGSPWPGRRQRRPGTTAPDDDPEFLRRLAEEQARKRREEGRKSRDDGEPSQSG